MVKYLVMVVVNILEAKTRLSELLEQVTNGERVVICKRNQPIAEIHPIPATRTVPRPLGLAAGAFTVTPGFFEPLPDDILSDFEAPTEDRSVLPSRVAEPEPPPYEAGARSRPRKRSRR